MWEYRPNQIRLFVLAASYITCVCVFFWVWLRLSSVPGSLFSVSSTGGMDATFLMVIIATAILYAVICRFAGLRRPKRIVSLWIVIPAIVMMFVLFNASFDQLVREMFRGFGALLEPKFGTIGAFILIRLAVYGALSFVLCELTLLATYALPRRRE
jgi:hypothetical protein